MIRSNHPLSSKDNGFEMDFLLNKLYDDIQSGVMKKKFIIIINIIYLFLFIYFFNGG